jgi:hypothetical protein
VIPAGQKQTVAPDHQNHTLLHSRHPGTDRLSHDRQTGSCLHLLAFEVVRFGLYDPGHVIHETFWSSDYAASECLILRSNGHQRIRTSRQEPILIYPKLEHTLHPLLRLRESGVSETPHKLHSPLSRTIYLPTNTRVLFRELHISGQFPSAFSSVSTLCQLYSTSPTDRTARLK